MKIELLRSELLFEYNSDEGRNHSNAGDAAISDDKYI